MKRALLLLSLLAVPYVLTYYMAEAAPSTDTASADTVTTTVSPLNKLRQYCGYSDKDFKIFRAGYEGDTITLESLKDKKHIGFYCQGAAAAGNKVLVLRCLDKGADPNWGIDGAAYGGHVEIVELMLSKGADPNWGLEAAAEGGHLDIAWLMLSKGADPNYGLEAAAEGGHMEIVQLMLSKGATDYDWGLEAAAENGHMEIVQFLLSKGANPNYGLWEAAAAGHEDIVQLLLEKGATLHLDAALDAAMINGHTECAKLILEAMTK